MNLPALYIADSVRVTSRDSKKISATLIFRPLLDRSGGGHA